MTLFFWEQTDWMQVRLGESPSQLVTKRMKNRPDVRGCTVNIQVQEHQKMQKNGGNVNGSYRRC